MPELMRRLGAYDGHPVTRAALRLALLTAARTLELRGAEWSELDTEAAMWRVPAARMKTKAEHLIPLSPQALSVLAELRPLTGAGRYLFPHESNPGRLMSENTMLFALYRMGYHSKATVHGFRALFSTVANEAGGFPPDVIERHLAHVERNKVRAAYHRAEYLPQRRELMRWWGERVEAWEKGAKVIALRQGAG
jgi:integrase